ncbi:MAG: hypothetical protein AAGF24_13075 [Cyanobacteria bacterium P01_H01_bin.121]
MKNSISPKHLTDALASGARQRGSPNSTKSRLNEAFGTIAQTVQQVLHDLFISGAEPIISERRGRDGTVYYQVYDPVYDEIHTFAAEDEVRIWLEQRYYRHSAKRHRP